MSSFIEFQAIVLDKLCSLENRLGNIEEVLGISSSENTEIIEESAETVKNTDENGLKKEFKDFQSELSEIKSLFSSEF